MRKLYDKDREPQLRSVVWHESGEDELLKDTPKIHPDDERRWQIELKKLQQPPKSRDKIIVPNKTPSP